MEAVKTELAVVVETSGIEKSKGEIISNTLSSFFVKADGWKSTIEALEITSIDDKGKMKMAREGRLELRRMRLDAQKLVDAKRSEVKARMADDLLEDKLWLKAGQMVGATFSNLETKLKDKEEYAERMEMERLHELEKARTNELMPFNEFCSIESMDLKNMTDEDFEATKTRVKKLFDLDAAEKKRVKEERIEKEKAEAEERERIRLENERLKKEAEERKARDEKRNKELRPYIQFIRDWNKLLNMDEEAYKKAFSDIDRGAREHYKYEAERKAKEEKERKEREAKLAKERAAQEAKLKKEREAKAKLEAELKAKKEAEDAEAAQLVIEAKAKLEEERKASLAPQKEKIQKWVNGFSIQDLDIKGMDDEAINTSKDILRKFHSFKKWAIEQSKLIK